MFMMMMMILFVDVKACQHAAGGVWLGLYI